ncbi:MAG: phosphotransferase [Selenomonadaceae bacterium]|nr:phosphotransferase [Selenomonadaceae bacterium]
MERERQKSQAAFLLGVPTAISYEAVRCGQRPELIFELVEVKSVREIVNSEPSRLEELIPKCAALARKIHELTPALDTFPKIAEIYHSRIDALDNLFTPAELDLLRKMTDALPPRATFLHGDFHQRNIMVQGDELLLIDMADAAAGHLPFMISSARRSIFFTCMAVCRAWDLLCPCAMQPLCWSCCRESGNRNCVRFLWHGWQWRQLLPVMRIGFPSAANHFCKTIQIFIINHILLMTAPLAAIASFAVLNSLNNIFLPIASGIITATLTMAGVFSGERDKDSLHSLLKISLTESLPLTFLMATLTCLAAPFYHCSAEKGHTPNHR